MSDQQAKDALKVEEKSPDPELPKETEIQTPDNSKSIETENKKLVTEAEVDDNKVETETKKAEVEPTSSATTPNLEQSGSSEADASLNILEISETEGQDNVAPEEIMETTSSDNVKEKTNLEKPVSEKEETMYVEESANDKSATTEEKSDKNICDENAAKFFKKTGVFCASDALNLIMDSSPLDETVSEFNDSAMSVDKTMDESRKELQDETEPLTEKTENDPVKETSPQSPDEKSEKVESTKEKDHVEANDNSLTENIQSEDKSEKDLMRESSPFSEKMSENEDLTVQKEEEKNLSEKATSDQEASQIPSNKDVDNGNDNPMEVESEIEPTVNVKDVIKDSPTSPDAQNEPTEDIIESLVKPVEENISVDVGNDSDESDEAELVIQEEKDDSVDVPPQDEETTFPPNEESNSLTLTGLVEEADKKTTAKTEVKVHALDPKLDIKMELTPIVHIEDIDIKKEKIAQVELSRKRSRPKSTSPKGGKSVEKHKIHSPGAKIKKKRPPPKDDGQDGRNDFYCWICHREGEVLCCELCPRVFHAKCLRMSKEPEGDWFCPECEKITNAECAETRSRAMAQLTPDQLAVHLRHVVQRLKIQGSEPFHEPVDTNSFTDYRDYIFHPMDLSTIEKKVKNKDYGSTEAFLADLKWIVHNCIIYNSINSILTQTAKRICKTADRELSEIEVCPECYLKSCRRRDNWFCDPCKEQHPLVWAKLQGFPHWPAKALRIEKSMVDVRFFGQHDRAWIPLSGCYLLSKDLPAAVKSKKKGRGPNLRGGLDNAMAEMQVYIDNVIKVTGKFDYAPPRTPLTHCDLHRSSEGSSYEVASGNDVPLKKMKMVTTGGEHPARGFTKKKRASMQFLDKTIESCKSSLGIDNLKDINQSSDDDSSSEDDQIQSLENKLKMKQMQDDKPDEKAAEKDSDDDDSDAELVIDLNDEPLESDKPQKESKPADTKPIQEEQAPVKAIKSILLNNESQSEKRKKEIAKALSEKIAHSSKSKSSVKRKMDPDSTKSSPVNKASRSFLDDLRPEKKKPFGAKTPSEPHKSNFDKISFNRKSSKHKLLLKQKAEAENNSPNQSSLKETARSLAQRITARKQVAEKQQLQPKEVEPLPNPSHATTNGTAPNADRTTKRGLEEFKKYSSKVMDTLESVFFDIYTTMIEPSSNSSSEWPNSSQQVSQVRLELERLKWMHQQEIAEVKHNHALVEAEIRQSLENEKNQVLREMKQKYEKERSKVVEETKKKQWCANCGNEAMFYCCWNTSYCDYPCQQRHWPQHMAHCTQALNNESKNEGAATKNSSAAAKTSSVKDNAQTYTQSSLVVPTSLPITKLSQTSANSFPPKGILISSHKPYTTVKAVKDDTLSVKVVTNRGSISAIGARLLAAKHTNDKPPLTTDAKPIHKPIAVFSQHVKTTLESPASPTHEKVAQDSPLSPDMIPTKLKYPVKSNGGDTVTHPAEAVIKESSKTSNIFTPSSPDNEADLGLKKGVLKSKPAVGVVPIIEPVLAKGYLSTLHKTLSTTSTFKPISSTELADMAKPTTTA